MNTNTNVEKRTDGKYHLNGKCRYGEKCFAKTCKMLVTVECSFFNGGKCSNTKCSFLHIIRNNNNADNVEESSDNEQDFDTALNEEFCDTFQPDEEEFDGKMLKFWIPPEEISRQNEICNQKWIESCMESQQVTLGQAEELLRSMLIDDDEIDDVEEEEEWEDCEDC